MASGPDFERALVGDNLMSESQPCTQVDKRAEQTANHESPFVSVIVPIRNEREYIENCLNSILNSDWPADRMEVLVVDGESDDGTLEIVQTMANKDARLKLMNNERRIQTVALNLGIEAAIGNMILRVDGHAEVETDFVSQSVKALVDHPECWCAGGMVETVNDTVLGKVIAAATSCPIGVGNSQFRIGNFEGYVDTVPFPIYWKWVFDRIGKFDEELVRNEDDELNARVLEQGGKIYLTPAIHSRYFSRSSFGKLWKQYYQYGVWRIRTVQKRGSASVRYLVPLAFVLCVILSLTVAAIFPVTAVWVAACAALYFVGLLIGATMVSRRTGWFGFVTSPIVFAILHFSYGLGSLFGVFWFSILRHRTLSHGMSR